MVDVFHIFTALRFVVKNITDTEIVDRPNYVGTDFWIEEIRIEELYLPEEKLKDIDRG